jgi:hypothetical protein
LDGRSIVEHLREGGDLSAALALADDRAARWTADS